MLNDLELLRYYLRSLIAFLSYISAFSPVKQVPRLEKDLCPVEEIRIERIMRGIFFLSPQLI